MVQITESNLFPYNLGIILLFLFMWTELDTS